MTAENRRQNLAEEARDRADRARERDIVERWKSRARECIANSARPRIELRFGWGFILLTALAGAPLGRYGFLLVPLAVATVIAVHELPRVVLLRSLGRSGTLQISAGGSQLEVVGDAVRGEAAVAFYAVGSLANLLVASLLLLISNGAAANSPLNLLHMWGLWHGCWGLIQGIPLVPLRAGEIVHGILQPGLRMAHAGASFIFLAATAGLLGKAAAWLMPLWLLLIAGSFAKFLRRSQEHLDETIGVTAEATAAEAALSEGNFQRAIELARLGLERARSEQQRSRLGKTLAWAAIAIPDAFAAHQALSVLPSRDIEPHLVAGYLASCNRIDESIQLLEEARAAGQRSRDMTKLLIDLHYRRGRNALALTIARADADLLSDAEREAVESTLGTPEPEQQAHST